MRKKIKASSLIYALIISIVMVMIGYAFYFYYYYSTTVANSQVVFDKLKNDIVFGIEMYLQEKSVLADVIYVHNRDSITVHSKRWGIYQSVFVQSTQKQYSISRNFIIGNKINDKKYALYLVDNNIPLSVSGKNIIRGNTFLPKSGIKTSNIEGCFFESAKMVDGDIHISQHSFSDEINANIDEIKKWNSTINNIIDTTVKYTDGMKMINNSKTTIAIKTDNSILSNCFLAGNIILICSKKTQLNNCFFDNIILVAPSIDISENNILKAQFLCKDSIIVQEKAKLHYPSAFTLINNESEDAYIRLKQNAQFRGAIICVTKKGIEKKITLAVEKDVEIYGDVVCNNTASLEGKIYGSLTVNNFLLVTNTAVYENHLLNTIIDNTQLPSKWGSPFFYTSTNKKAIIDWY